MEGSVPGTHTILAQFSYMTPSHNTRDARRGHSKATTVVDINASRHLAKLNLNVVLGINYSKCLAFS